MSVQVMARVFEAGGFTAPQKAVLLALANHANETGESVYPSVERLAVYTALNERTVRRTLKWLRKSEILLLERPAIRNSHRPNEYSISLDKLVRDQNLKDNKAISIKKAGGPTPPGAKVPGGTVPPGRGSGAPWSGGTVPSESSLEPSENHQSASRDVDDINATPGPGEPQLIKLATAKEDSFHCRWCGTTQPFAYKTPPLTCSNCAAPLSFDFDDGTPPIRSPKAFPPRTPAALYLRDKTSSRRHRWDGFINENQRSLWEAAETLHGATKMTRAVDWALSKAIKSSIAVARVLTGLQNGGFESDGKEFRRNDSDPSESHNVRSFDNETDVTAITQPDKPLQIVDGAPKITWTAPMIRNVWDMWMDDRQIVTPGFDPLQRARTMFKNVEPLGMFLKIAQDNPAEFEKAIGYPTAEAIDFLKAEMTK